VRPANGRPRGTQHSHEVGSWHRKKLLMPHFSVSMNGCRDLITLSNAASNHDLLQSDAVTLAAAAVNKNIIF
jgi:hypothetical protein